MRLPKLPVALAALGGLMVSVGVAAAYVPAGLVVGGLECIGAAYLIAYLEARRK